MAHVQADFITARDLLASSGISAMGCVANSRPAAVAAAEAAGFPCVMKLISPEVIHKSDVGVVILDIADAVSAGNSYDLVLANGRRAGAQHIDGVLVQPQTRPGFEVLVGARQDPIFGPLTLIGYGGRYVELFKAVATGVGVLNREDIERMLGETVVGRIVAGFRGPALDQEALIDLAIRVSRLMVARPEVVELDLNPVILYPRGCAIVDARVILGEPAPRPSSEELGGTRLQSLQAIFNPSSVAVVGASGPGSIGGNILAASRGVPRLYPINPKRDTLLGLKCYPDFQAIGSPVDVGVFAVGPEATINSFRQFCEAGGKGAIIVSDGFAEIGRSDLEEKLHAISEQHGVVYLGPNGLGVLDNFSGLNTLFFPPERLTVNRSPGAIGVISQSGGIGTELLEMAAADNLAIGKWISCGNASGISIAELLEHLGEDVRIRVVAVYLEGLRNGLQFMEVARRVAARKPVLVIKGGWAEARAPRSQYGLAGRIVRGVPGGVSAGGPLPVRGIHRGSENPPQRALHPHGPRTRPEQPGRRRVAGGWSRGAPGGSAHLAGDGTREVCGRHENPAHALARKQNPRGERRGEAAHRGAGGIEPARSLRGRGTTIGFARPSES